ncbi:MAG: 6-carboxytetrahydropterin synthase [Balneolales bacterium]
MIHVTRIEKFNAAHRLHNPNKSDEWNLNVFGECNHSNWHGHNYTLEVTVSGEPDPETGYIIDLGDLKKVIRDRIVAKCDHKNLNLDVDFLRNIIPSTENLVYAFFNELKNDIAAVCTNGGQLSAVRLYETDKNYAEYREAVYA